jgi:hypothetical protein
MDCLFGRFAMDRAGGKRGVMKSTFRILMVGLSVLAATVVARPARADCALSAADIDAAVAAAVAACPCSGPTSGGEWRNHGQFQRCAVQSRNQLRRELRRQGCTMPPGARRTIASCAARSTCGKPDAVLCCAVTGTGTCDLQLDSSYKCSNDNAKACITAADCTTTSGPRVRRNATACTNRGGYVSGTGSVCSGCTTPRACCLTTGECQVLTAEACSAVGAPAASGGSSCDPNPCPPPQP